MDSRAAIVCHAFIQASPPEQRKKLLDRLSADEAREFMGLEPTMGNPLDSFDDVEEELPHVHYSWFTPFLRSLSENEIKLFLSCLTTEQIKNLKQALLLTNSHPPLTSIVEGFLKKTLVEALFEEEPIPISCLPVSALNGLLELSYDELRVLIDLISMHDLSVEIRQIIETSKLNAIYAILSKSQMAYLKTLLHKKEPVSFKKMGLSNWNGDPDTLRSMLLQRGINRIAKALYSQNNSLMLYVAHRLESEKGKMLMKLCAPLDHAQASLLLVDQVLSLMQSIKTQQPPENL